MDYNFTKVLSDKATQGDVFQESFYPLLKDMLSKAMGGLFFSYGITGSGKTYTIVGTDEEPGMLPRAIETLFELQSKIRENSMLKHSQDNYKEVVKVDGLDYGIVDYSHGLIDDIQLSISGLEVYGKKIYDLTDTNTKKIPLKSATLQNNTIVKNARIEELTDIEKFKDLIAIYSSNRRVAKTKKNDRSSRSHAIYTIKAELFFKMIDSKRVVKIVELCVVDLAGSESHKQINTSGVTFKEGCNINNSLLVLGRCLKAMKEGDNATLPVRDSMLTRLLIKHFSEKNNVIMLTNIEFKPNENLKQETIKVLEYASCTHEAKLISANAIERIRDSIRLIDHEAEFKRLREFQLWNDACNVAHKFYLQNLVFRAKWALQCEVKRIEMQQELISKPASKKKLKDLESTLRNSTSLSSSDRMNLLIDKFKESMAGTLLISCEA